MSLNEQGTRYHLIDPVLRCKGYNDHQWIRLETSAPVDPIGPKGRRRRGSGRTDYLLCVRPGDMPTALPAAVLEAKKETDDPLKGLQQAKGYADCRRFDVKYVFSTNGHLYGEFDFFTRLQNGPFHFADFPTHPDLTARYAKDNDIDITRRCRYAVVAAGPGLQKHSANSEIRPGCAQPGPCDVGRRHHQAAPKPAYAKFAQAQIKKERRVRLCK